MPLFIWGRRGYAEELGYIVQECPQCGTVGPFRVVEAKKKFTVYFVPTFSYSRRIYLVCPACQASFEVPKEQVHRVTESALSQQELSALVRGLAESRDPPRQAVREITKPTPDTLGSAAIRLEVGFYSQDEVSVDFEVKGEGDVGEWHRITLFCLFTLRQLYNLAGHPAAVGLAGFLNTAGDSPSSLGLVERATDGLELVARRPHPAPRRFEGEYIPAGEAGAFLMSAEGFGPLARGIGYYAPAAVTAVLKALARRYLTNEQFQEALCVVVQRCRLAHEQGVLTAENQAPIALGIVIEAMRGWDPRVEAG